MSGAISGLEKNGLTGRENDPNQIQILRSRAHNSRRAIGQVKVMKDVMNTV